MGCGLVIQSAPNFDGLLAFLTRIPRQLLTQAPRPRPFSSHSAIILRGCINKSWVSSRDAVAYNHVMTRPL
jgi:hypothetical protein